MSMNEMSLEQLRRLVSQIEGGGLNLFLGAGISRDAPTNGPIWSEMQVGLLQAVFDRMEEEGWPAASNFPADREKTRELNVRPELFWREMIGVIGEDLVWRALDAVGVGSSNDNHARIATLLESGRCRWAVTTNFDEHVESLLADDVPVVIPMDDVGFSDSDLSTYVKLHGSIGSERTLSYTLEHYDTLKQRHERLLETILPGRPLVIAGYSGYDTDVFPVLCSLANRIPWIVVIRHPGSPNEQPVLQLAAEGSRSCILESTCPQALKILTEGFDHPCRDVKPWSSRDIASYYAEAAGGVDMHMCPMILVTAFRLVRAWDLVCDYAWLTHDAVKDTRYRLSISNEECQSIHQNLAINLKMAGDPTGAQIMLNEAKAFMEESGMGFMGNILTEAVTRDAPSQLDGSSSPTRISVPGRPSDVLLVDLEMRKTLGRLSKKDIFEINWILGVTRWREGQPGLAIEAFNEAMAIVLDDVVTHLERGHFLLDFGGAVFTHGAELQDDELAKQAHIILLSCERCTEDSRDFGTNAQANLMLAKLYIGGDSFGEAWNCIRLARLAVSKTEDTALAERIEEFARILEDIQKRIGSEDV
jgi:hypothetical protein